MAALPWTRVDMMHEEANASMGLRRWADRLIHPRLLGDASPEVLRRARVTGGISLSIAAMATLATYLFWHYPWSHPFLSLIHI